MIEAVLLNGTVGAGKTTTGEALGSLLAERGVPHAVLDLDAFRMIWPPRSDDPFHQSVVLANVRDVVRNYRAAGAERLVIVGAIETGADLADLRAALEPCSLMACRLTIDPTVAEQRLRRLHATDTVDWDLDWHLRRSPELAAILERSAIDDEVIDVGSLTPQTLAGRIAALCGW